MTTSASGINESTVADVEAAANVKTSANLSKDNDRKQTLLTGMKNPLTDLKD
jgi:hypothetical protein